MNVTADVIRFINQIPYFISNSATGQALGRPIAGLFFYVSSLFYQKIVKNRLLQKKMGSLTYYYYGSLINSISII